MTTPQAPVTTNTPAFTQLAESAPTWFAGLLNAQHEFRSALQEVRDQAVSAIWNADGNGYITVTTAIGDSAFNGQTRQDVSAYISSLLDAGKFAEIDAIMGRIDQAEESYDPGEDEEDEEDEDDGGE